MASSRLSSLDLTSSKCKVQNMPYAKEFVEASRSADNRVNDEFFLAGWPTMARAVRLALLALMLCFLHAGTVKGQTSLYDYKHGRPSFGMSHAAGKGKKPSPEASLSSYDQQILANGPPGEGAGNAGTAGLPNGPTPYGAARPSSSGG